MGFFWWDDITDIEYERMDKSGVIFINKYNKNSILHFHYPVDFTHRPYDNYYPRGNSPYWKDLYDAVIPLIPLTEVYEHCLLGNIHAIAIRRMISASI